MRVPFQCRDAQRQPSRVGQPVDPEQPLRREAIGLERGRNHVSRRNTGMFDDFTEGCKGRRREWTRPDDQFAHHASSVSGHRGRAYAPTPADGMNFSAKIDDAGAPNSATIARARSVMAGGPQR